MANTATTIDLNTVELMLLATTLWQRFQTEDASLSIDSLQSMEDMQTTFLSRIRTSMNSRSPVNRLPPEILLLVLSFVPDKGHSDYDVTVVWPCHYTHVCQLVAVTQVCRHWRDVVIGAPSLWTSIHQPGPDCVQSHALHAKLVEHQRGTPLDLYVRNSQDGFMKAVSSRIRDLTIVEEVVALDKIPDHLTFSAPCLEYLMVDGTNNNRPEVFLTSALLFKGDAPLLQTLVLESVSWIPSNAFVNLTRLSISSWDDQKLAPGERDLSALLALLSHASRLQDLLLVAVRWPTHGRGADVVQPIPMDYMRRLLFRHVPLTCVAVLLSHLCLPQNIALAVTGPQKMKPKNNMTYSPNLSLAISRLTAMRGIFRFHLRQHNAKWSSIVMASDTSAIRISQCWDVQKWLVGLRSVFPLSEIRQLMIESMFHQKVAASKASCVFGTLLDAMPSLESVMLPLVDDAERHEYLRILSSSLCVAPSSP